MRNKIEGVLKFARNFKSHTRIYIDTEDYVNYRLNISYPKLKNNIIAKIDTNAKHIRYFNSSYKAITNLKRLPKGINFDENIYEACKCFKESKTAIDIDIDSQFITVVEVCPDITDDLDSRTRYIFSNDDKPELNCTIAYSEGEGLWFDK